MYTLDELDDFLIEEPIVTESPKQETSENKEQKKNKDYGYYSKICTQQTNKRLIEAISKLKPSSVSVARIHADKRDQKDTKSDTREYSLIELKALDYSGSETVKASLNISPDEAQYIYSKVCKGNDFKLTDSKLVSVKDGLVTSLTVYRAEKNQNGETQNYPCGIKIEVGHGKVSVNQNGSATYKDAKMEHSIEYRMKEEEFFQFFNRINSWIVAWECAVTTKQMLNGG